MAAAGQRSPGGSQFSLGADGEPCVKSAIVKSLAEKTQYWSHKALLEDKKRCLADMPHCAHQVANTLEDFHEDAKAKSNRAIAERVKLHGKVENDTWGRRPSEPTHDYGSQQFYSHAMLAEAKRRVLPMASARCAPGETLDKTSQAGSKSGSKSARELRGPGSAAGSIASSGAGASGAGSPDIWKILNHGGKTVKDVHNQTAAKLEQLRKTQASRDMTTYARSFGDMGGHKSLEDMTNSEIQYQRYGDAKGYAAANVPDGWCRPVFYNSQTMFHIDKMRHATPVNRGEAFTPQHVIADAYPSWGGGADANEDDSKPLYRSAETMRQHKKKHRADVRAAPGSRMVPGTSGLSPGVEFSARSPMSPPGMSDSFSAPPGTLLKTSGLTSHRDFRDSKKFHTVKVDCNQDLQATDIAAKPWPKPGDKLVVYSRANSAAGSNSDTPAHPSVSADKGWVTTYGTDIHAKSLQKYSSKSGVRNIVESEASDAKLLHMSQAEFADRKALCQTHVRTVPGATSVRDERHLGPRKDPGNERISSQKQLEYSKAVHKYMHDDPKRAKPAPAWNPPPETPAPRSGQWTPAHA